MYELYHQVFHSYYLSHLTKWENTNLKCKSGSQVSKLKPSSSNQSRSAPINNTINPTTLRRYYPLSHSQITKTEMKS